METTKTKGSGFLKVTGILMIIGGGISIIMGIIAALGVAAIAYISDGKWFLWEQYLLTGVRTPKSADPWA